MPTAAPDNPQLLDSSLIEQAIHCTAAADAYAVVSELRNWFPLYLLLGIAMECALKAYAINRGATETELKGLGHDLERALQHAESKSLPLELTDEDRGVIALLSQWHKTKATTYPLVRGYVIPKPALARRVVDRTIGAAYVAIWGPNQYRHDRDRTLGLSVPSDINYGT
jgi:hypothetical protein